jgi:membrane protein DedA with SNARE-associated domain
MFDFLDGPVRELVVAVYGAIGYVGVALIVALESVVIPIPSELVLPFAGFLVADPSAIEPLTGDRWNVLLLVVAGTAGSVLGALIAYGIGFWAGRPFLLRFGRYLLIKPADIERTEAFFARHGGKAAFAGRMVPVVRSLVSYVAGVARMPLLPFIVYSALGSLPWVILLVGGGALLGESWPTIEAILKPLERVVLVGLVALSAAAVAWKVRGHLRGDASAHDAGRDSHVSAGAARRGPRAPRRGDLEPEPVPVEDR